MKELYPSHPDMFTITWVQNFSRNRPNMSGNGSKDTTSIEFERISIDPFESFEAKVCSKFWKIENRIDQLVAC